MTAFPNSETGKNFSSPKSVRWRQFRKKTSSSRIFGGGGGGCAVAIQFQFVYQTSPPPTGSVLEFDGGKQLFFLLPRFGEKGVCLSSLFLGLAVWVRGHLVWVFGFKSAVFSGVWGLPMHFLRSQRKVRGKTGKLR